MSLDVGIANVKRVERLVIGSEAIPSVGEHITVGLGQRGKIHSVGAVTRVGGVETVNRDIIATQINCSLGNHRGGLRGGSRDHLNTPLDAGIGCASGTYRPEDHSQCRGRCHTG